MLILYNYKRLCLRANNYFMNQFLSKKKNKSPVFTYKIKITSIKKLKIEKKTAYITII